MSRPLAVRFVRALRSRRGGRFRPGRGEPELVHDQLLVPRVALVLDALPALRSRRPANDAVEAHDLACVIQPWAQYTSHFDHEVSAELPMVPLEVVVRP